MTIDAISAAVIEKLRQKGKTLATAESCTGGGIGHALTGVPGSSAVFLGGVISYSNDVKEKILGVPSVVLHEHGAVSEQTARTMAEGVRNLLGSDISVSVTGIAGPASDDTKKPVGLVYIAVCNGNETVVLENHFSGSRADIRNCSIQTALQLILDHV